MFISIVWIPVWDKQIEMEEVSNRNSSRLIGIFQVHFLDARHVVIKILISSLLLTWSNMEQI